MDRAGVRAGPEDVGDQTLIRGLDTAFPFVRPGLSVSKRGHRSCDRPHSPSREFPCRGPALAAARLMLGDAPVATCEGGGGRSSPSRLEWSMTPVYWFAVA